MGKNPGKDFERDFIKSVPDRCDITRLKDGGGWSDATNTRFTSSNPCDFIIFSSRSLYGEMYKFELKSTLGKSLPFGNIKKHQMDSLCEAEEKGVVSGFVVNFRDLNETYYTSASLLWVFMNETDRKSIPISWFREVGNARVIEQSLIRVRYRYDLEWL